MKKFNKLDILSKDKIKERNLWLKTKDFQQLLLECKAARKLFKRK